MEKVNLKAELCASATERTSSVIECTFSNVNHTASASDTYASAAENSNSTVELIVSFTEQVSFMAEFA